MALCAGLKNVFVVSASSYYRKLLHERKLAFCFSKNILYHTNTNMEDIFLPRIKWKN